MEFTLTKTIQLLGVPPWQWQPYGNSLRSPWADSDNDEEPAGWWKFPRFPPKLIGSGYIRFDMIWLFWLRFYGILIYFFGLSIVSQNAQNNPMRSLPMFLDIKSQWIISQDRNAKRFGGIHPFEQVGDGIKKDWGWGWFDHQNGFWKSQHIFEDLIHLKIQAPKHTNGIDSTSGNLDELVPQDNNDRVLGWRDGESLTRRKCDFFQVPVLPVRLWSFNIIYMVVSIKGDTQ